MEENDLRGGFFELCYSKYQLKPTGSHPGVLQVAHIKFDTSKKNSIFFSPRSVALPGSLQHALAEGSLLPNGLHLSNSLLSSGRERLRVIRVACKVLGIELWSDALEALQVVGPRGIKCHNKHHTEGHPWRMLFFLVQATPSPEASMKRSRTSWWKAKWTLRNQPGRPSGLMHSQEYRDLPCRKA